MWIWTATRIGKRFRMLLRVHRWLSWAKNFSEEQIISKALPFKVYLSSSPAPASAKEGREQPVSANMSPSPDRHWASVFTLYDERFLEIVWFLVPFWVEECCYVVRYRGQHENLLDIDCVFASLRFSCWPASQLALPSFDAAQRTRKFIYLRNMLSKRWRKKKK